MHDTPMGRVLEALTIGTDHGINPPVSDSSTFAFDSAAQMHAMIEGEVEGRFIYSRHLNSTTVRLGRALAALEGAEAGLAFSAGMAAISTTVLALCGSGDEIVASRTIYGGTYALLANFLPRFGIRTRFVDTDDLDEVRAAMGPATRLLYCESLSNPLLGVADLPALGEIAKSHGVPLVVDNTFSPLIVAPLEHGADIVVLSLTKFVNGMSDGLGGGVCASQDFIDRLLDLEDGPALVLGGTPEAHRAASIAKNMFSLDLRMRCHGRNAHALAEALDGLGLPVHYPGLSAHPHHDRWTRLARPGYDAGGVLAVDLGSLDAADRFVSTLARSGAALVAVSLGCPRTVVTVPSFSTSAEIPEEDQDAMGLRPGLVRIATGLEADTEALVAAFVAAAQTAVAATVG